MTVRDRITRAIAAHHAVEAPLEGRKPSAVMVLLEGHEDDLRLIFQVRANTVRYHRGEISFPGGRQDEEDATLLDTALRETFEEIGIPPEAITVLGALDDTAVLGSNYMIRPFVGTLAEGVTADKIAPDEVDELLSVPLAHLLDPECRTWIVVNRGDGKIRSMPAFQYGEHQIWGATGRILTQLLDLIEATPE